MEACEHTAAMISKREQELLTRQRQIEAEDKERQRLFDAWLDGFASRAIAEIDRRMDAIMRSPLER